LLAVQQIQMKWIDVFSQNTTK